jgi:hypothetical protein
MAKNKTAATDQSVIEFLSNVDNDMRRNDGIKLLTFFESVTGFEPKCGGQRLSVLGAIINRYDTGHEGDAPLAGFSPRKDALVLYFASDYKEKEILLSQLGKHKVSKACVYVKKIDDIDMKVLEQMLVNSMAQIMAMYPSHSEP